MLKIDYRCNQWGMMKLLIIGCVLTAVFSLQTKTDSIAYYGELRYNHVSLHVPIEGIMPFKRYPKGKSHFQFKFDDKKRIVEIVNHTFGRLPLHPLTHFCAHRISIDYENGQEIRRYFDIKNQQLLTFAECIKRFFQSMNLALKHS